MFERLQINTDSQGVAHVQLARADKLNALDRALFTELAQAGAQLGADPAVRAVVLSGQGRAFCAGLDLSLFADPDLRGLLQHSDAEGANSAQQAVWVWHTLPVPVIAAVHGIAFGGGLQLMLGADLRYIAADTKLSIMEIDYGIIPDIGGTQLWAPLVRDDIVRELMYTGRLFTGTEAVAMGFATRVCADPLAEALRTAAEIAAKSPHAVRAAKRLANLQRAGSTADGLRREADEQLALLYTPNQLEAVAAKRERRPARFIAPDV
jgi:enoyl-CoA hydratase/carnithine racemase